MDRHPLTGCPLWVRSACQVAMSVSALHRALPVYMKRRNEMAADTRQLPSLPKHVRPNVPARPFDAVQRHPVIRGTASHFLEKSLIHSIQSMECVLRSRGDEDSIARGRSRDAEERSELSCKRSRRALSTCRSRSGRRCSNGVAAAAKRGTIRTYS
ncbi:hypothetical protein DM02DRAFT_241988 [Periconia macrospinosa]|uniref:Uncharacterized protein n=1 Tax=Periconia macrospinosa TaxID=97972 RepID=A0A2V1D7W8_9PLEO|nr:hypothetical protein DM02DRAFT_241988 [Periconia macrospinosa]